MSAPMVRAEGDRSIAVGGSVINSLLITADHARIFVGDYVDLADSYIEPWEILERVHLARYVERPWLTDSLDQFLANHDRGYFVVEAQAGLGKTTFMAHLATTRGWIHNFVELAPGEEGIIPSIKNLTSQLIVAWRLLPDNALHVPVSSINPEYLRSCIYKAAQQRDTLRADEPIVIVIDSVELAGRIRGGAPLGLPRQLPKGVYVVMSQRPGSEVFFTTTDRGLLTIDQSDARNIDALRSYVEKAVAEEPIRSVFRSFGTSSDELQRLIVSRSAGVWIYAYYVLAEIRSGLRSAESLALLPIGLWRYYAEFFTSWKRRNKSLWDDVGLELLACLAVYQEPLNFDEIHLVSKFGSGSAAKELLTGEWAPFVTTRTDRGSRFTLYHASSKDFILGTLEQPKDLTFVERTFALDLSGRCAKVQQDIVAAYFAAWGKPSENFPSLDWRNITEQQNYGTRFLPQHLLSAAQSTQLHQTLVATKDKRNAWYELKSHQDDLEAYLSHLFLAREESTREAASTKTADAGIAGVLRYALMISSLGSIATNTPPCLLDALLEKGLWSFDRARSYAGRCNVGEQRARIDIQLFQRAKGSLRDWCLADFIRNLQLLNGTPLGFFQVALIRDLVTSVGKQLTEQDADHLFGAICRIRGSLYQLQSLASLSTLGLTAQQAKAIHDHATTLFGRSGDTLDAAMDSYHCAVLRVETRLRTLCLYSSDQGERGIGLLIEQIMASKDPRHLLTVISVMSKCSKWPKISVQYDLPSIDQMVERLVQWSTDPEAEGLHGHLIFEVLQYSDQPTDHLVMPLIKQALEVHLGNIDLARLMGRLVKIRPEFVETFVEVSSKQRRSIRALCLAHLVPYLKDPSNAVRDIVQTFSQMPDEPMVGEHIEPIAPFLSASQVEECAALLRRQTDLSFPRALGLAALGTAHSDGALIREALSSIHLITDQNKVDRLLRQALKNADMDLLRAAQIEVEKIGDDEALSYAIAGLFQNLESEERFQAGELLVRSINAITDEYRRYSTLVHVLTDVSSNLSLSQRKVFIESVLKIPSRSYPESKIQALLSLSDPDDPKSAASLKEAAILVCTQQSDKAHELKCMGLVLAEMSEGERQIRLPSIIATFKTLDTSGQRYAFPRLAPFLPQLEAEELVHEIILDTPDDKYYGLEELCPWMGKSDISNLLNGGTHYDGSDIAQIRPALIQRCAMLGDTRTAIEQCKQQDSYRCAESIRELVPLLGLDETRQAQQILQSLEFEDYESHEETRDQAVASIWVRFAELGEVDLAFQGISKIPREGTQTSGLLRVLPYLDQHRAKEVLANAIAIYRERLPASERLAMRSIYLGLPKHLMLESARITFFIASLEAASRDERSNVLFDVRGFAPWLSATLGKTGASLCYKELARIHEWWQ